jgi:predicted secreted protein
MYQMGIAMAEPEPKTVTLLDTPEIRLESGAAVNVEVPAKGATGHVWTVDADPKQVRVLAHTKRPSTDSFGGGGVEIFTLQPLSEGHSTIRFQLGAPWKKGPTEEHELALDVSSSKAD